MSIEPFRIDELTLEGGARIGICRLPGRSGDLEGDLAMIRQWHPDLVISMTEAAEMAEKGAGNLIVRLADLRLAHAHFPIRDYGVPDAEETGWAALSPRLQAILERNGRLLLHCLGGKGRSGMVAMRLLTERGMAAEEALKRIRNTRPGAVETDAQEHWGAGNAIPT
ncbi:MAG: protein phosphatase [Rhizobiales bacterium PAR1]|nr:MAG: protein phosphatase [Rhizobiales bacterium PAR1]